MVWDDQIGTTSTSSQVFSHWEYYDCRDDEMNSADLGDEPETNPILVEGGGGDDETQCKRAIFRTVYSDVPGSYVPVVDVKVRARRWFTTHMGSTGVDGRYSADGTFTNDANYSIQWEMYHFSIRSGSIGQAQLNGPKKSGDWNPKIGKFAAKAINDEQQQFAIVFQAARDYYYGNILGLKRPPKNGTFKPQMKIASFHEKNPDSNGNHRKDLRLLPGTSWIRIWNNPKFGSSENYAFSDDLYATSIHELAHASHWELRKNNWSSSQTTDYVVESWARGVQWAIGRLRYKDYRGGGSSDEYTNLVIDLIDDRAPLKENGDPENFNNGFEVLEKDDVHGYTIKQIENTLGNTSNWNDWEDNIKNNYENSTEQNLHALFEAWSN